MKTLLALVIGLVATPAFASQSPQSPPVIVVQGEGAVTRAADLARVTVGVRARASKPAEAQRQAEEAMRAVTAALKATGLSEDALRATSCSVEPDIDDKSRVRGYDAESRLQVRVDSIANLPSVMDALGTSGASMTRLEFELKDRQSAEDEALKLAVQNAMRRARVAAEGAGAQLGPIVRLGEQPIFSGSAGADASGVGAIQIRFVHRNGEIEIRVQVTLSIGVR